MKKLIIYDTSNFQDFPIGGQLTSIRNYLLFLSENHKELCDKTLLIGITTDSEKVGKIQKVIIGNEYFKMLPVLYRNSDLNHVEKSLRVEYLKSLFKFRRTIDSDRDTIHYVHTPEAFFEIAICHPLSKIAVFSHGNFYSMPEGFRFYNNNMLIKLLFNSAIDFLVKRANYIFVLDNNSLNQYKKKPNRIALVNNSIVPPTTINLDRKTVHLPIRVLFVGRLSDIKRIDTIIDAVDLLNGNAVLTIIGDGEKKNSLLSHTNKKKNAQFIHFIGSVKPEEVSEYMMSNDILVLNSSHEGKPMVIIEALSCALPIVTTKVGGIGDIIDPGNNAEVTEGTAESIVKAINKIACKYGWYSNNALKKSKEYSYDVVNSEIHNILGSL